MLIRSALFLSAFSLAMTARSESMRVQIQTGQVRATPSFLGTVVATVGYGQPVDVVSTQSAWRQVRTPDGHSGWMHNSALTVKRLSTQSGGTVSTGASGDELALAGKGFNKDVEAQFKTAHAELDFAWVDKMSSFKASAAEVERFVQGGGLKQPGGGK